MFILFKISPLGAGLGPNFILSDNFGLTIPYKVTRQQLIDGVLIQVNWGATKIYVRSTGALCNDCENPFIKIYDLIPPPPPPTTTTSTSSSTTSTTTINTPTTTTSTTTASTTTTSSTTTSTSTSTSTSTTTSTSSSTTTTTTTLSYKSWVIVSCEDSCASGGVGGPACNCVGIGSRTIYTNPSVATVNDLSTAVWYSDSALTILTDSTAEGFYWRDNATEIWSIDNGNPSLLCNIGGPC
jgi:hypothetical protein